MSLEYRAGRAPREEFNEVLHGGDHRRSFLTTWVRRGLGIILLGVKEGICGNLGVQHSKREPPLDTLIIWAAIARPFSSFSAFP